MIGEHQKNALGISKYQKVRSLKYKPTLLRAYQISVMHLRSDSAIFFLHVKSFCTRIYLAASFSEEGPTLALNMLKNILPTGL